MVAWALISLVISVILAAGDRDRESLHASEQRLNDTTTELVARRVQQDATIRSLEPSEQEADRDDRGTGLGLCLDARFVEAMGASIHVESSAGAGTRFTATIPVRTMTVDFEHRVR